MEFKSGKFGSFLSQVPPTSVRLGAEQLVFQSGDAPLQPVAYPDIQNIQQKSWMVGWADIIVSTGTRTFEAKRLSAKDAPILERELARRVRDAVAKDIATYRDCIDYLCRSIDVLLRTPAYLSDRDRRIWREAYVDRASGEQKLFLARLDHPFLQLERVEPGARDKVATIKSFVSARPVQLRERNKAFVEEELKKYATFFDRVEKRPLTHEQRRAAVVMEDRNLLVAPAGSGKTSALIGKIGYALKSGFCRPSEILVVAFNKSAAEELRERIRERLLGFDGIEDIEVHTFHSFGQQIIAAATGEKPSLAAVAEDEVARGRVFQDIFNHLLASDPAYRMNYILFQALYAMPASDPASFESVEAWQKYLRANGQTSDKKTGFRTLNGELVKSQGELAIANWLFLYGVAYEYEHPYKYKTADEQYRQYKPDFYFPEIDVYLEHYALDANGRPPPAFGAKYTESMAWKRALHESKETECLETTFNEFIQGTLFDKLSRELTARGIKLSPRPEEELLSIIENWVNSGTPLARLMSAVAKHAKSNLMTESEIRDAASRDRSLARARLFTSLLLPVIAEYERRLRASDEIDFEDMIGLAIDHLKANASSTRFQLVLVDEFQDISVARARLVRTVLEQNPEARLFAVGDDWQAIYRFAGSDISLFWDFEKFFGPTETLFLTQTFRFNQGISDISAQFVSQNPDQLGKEVKSTNPRNSKVVAAFLAETAEDEREAFLSILRTLAQARQAGEPPVKVYALARYNKVLDSAKSWLNGFASSDVVVQFLTIHRSKGLEADYVILLGMNSRPFGFPSTQEDDPLLQLVMPRPEPFPFAEERRLFYVALTRTRNILYTLSNAQAPSGFIKEIAEDWEETGALQLIHRGANGGPDDEIRRCPDCAIGRVVVRQSQYGPFLGCSQFPDCTYKGQLAAQA